MVLRASETPIETETPDRAADRRRQRGRAGEGVDGRGVVGGQRDAVRPWMPAAVAVAVDGGR